MCTCTDGTMTVNMLMCNSRGKKKGGTGLVSVLTCARLYNVRR